MRVNVDHSEGGTCNSQFSKSIQGVDPNTSGDIRIGQGYNPVQLQDLTLCGSVTAGRQSLKFIKFKNIFDLHRSPVCRERIWLRAPYLLCVRYITVPSDPVIGKTWHALFSHSSLSNQGVNTGKIQGMRVNIDHSEGGTCNSQFSKCIQDVDLNTSGGIRIGQGYNHVQLQGLTLCGSVTAGRQSLKFIKFLKYF